MKSVLKTVGLLVLRTGGQGVSVLLYMALANLLPIGDMGAFLVAYNWFLTATTLARIGQDKGILRFANEYERDPPRLGAYLGWLIPFTCASALLAALLVLLASALLAASGRPVSTSTYAVLALAAVPFTVLVNASTLLAARRRPLVFALLLEWSHPVLLLLALGGLALLGARTLSAVEIAQLFAVAFTVVSIGALLLAMFDSRGVALSLPNRADVVMWTANAARLLLLTGLLFLLLRVDLMIAGVLLSDRDAAHLGIAGRLGLLTYMGLVAAQVVAAPDLVRALGAGDLAAVERISRRGALMAMAFGASALLGFAALGETLLALFGDEYRTEKPLLLIYAAGYVVAAAFGMSGFVLALGGRERRYALIAAAALVATIVLGVVLALVIGPAGVAMATVAGLVGLQAGAAIAIRRKLGIRVWPRPADAIAALRQMMQSGPWSSGRT